MLRRLYGKTWRPDREKTGVSGPEQLQAHLASLERKAHQAQLAESKVKGKKATPEELQKSVEALWASAVNRRKKLEQWIETERTTKCAAVRRSAW